MKKAKTGDDDALTDSGGSDYSQTTAARRNNRCHLNYKPQSLKYKYVIKPTLLGYRKALDFRNYRLRHLGSRMSSCDKSSINKRKKKVAVEMESHLFDPADPISILDFLQTFRRACNSLSIHDGTAMFLLFYFMMAAQNAPSILHWRRR